ncbi:LysR family transcriptional regulator [Amycolatopsis rifamycinica]|uniref:LysR family transcriptional regulator n=1 Tax=Amycolatopsis rifamycinica TaxID=287986 RepID=A0A066U380_9PSEU|nr:LysR family transcriptional regulator [Amycolatopsis rifamycinica]KDN18569.1 LysR family transcriptional regulator [Amycolatopsis rifamycinica]
MSDLDLLATFLEIYRRGSLTAAAAALGVSQPAVSGQLARLESRLDAVLFERSRRGAVPTPRAHELARRVASPLDQLGGALVEDADRRARQGTVRLGAAGELTASRLVPALAPLVGEGLQLAFTLGLAEDLLSALAEGELDLVVSSVRPAADRRGLAATPFVDEEFVLVATPTTARSIDRDRLDEDPAAALAHLPIVAYGRELPIVRRYWRSEFGRRPANPVSMIVPDLRAVLVAVVAGAGISVLPRYLADSALAAGSLEVVHHTRIPPLNTLYLVTPSGPTPAPVTLVQRRLHQQAEVWGPL